MGWVLTAGATIWLVHMGCAAVFMAMAVLVIARRPHALIHRTCGIVIADFALWSGCLAVSHHPHVSRATAARFYDLGAVAWAPFASLALLFLTSLSRPSRLRSKWFVVALIVPAALTLAAQWSGNLAADYVSRPWGWAYVWSDSGATTFFHLYYSSYVLFGVTGLLLQAWQGLSPVRRRQAQIIGWSALPPLVLGSLTDVVLPRAGVRSIPNMGPDFALLWVVGLVYALVRYRVLELRPVVAAERVMQMMSDALLLVDADGTIVWHNASAASLFGQTLAGLRATSIAKLVGEPAVAGRGQVVVRGDHGAPIDLEYSASEIRGDLGERVGWAYVLADVTHRKRAEEELRHARDELETRVAARTVELEEVNARLRTEVTERERSQQRYRLLIESMHDGLWVLGPDDRATLVNARLGEILGYPDGGILGRPMLDFVDEASGADCAAALAEARAGRGAKGEWHLRAPDGHTRNVMVQVTPLPGGTGDDYPGCVVTVTDVTERDGMQAQLARAHRLAGLGMLAAGVGHEINNPLTFVILNLEEIRRLAGAADVTAGAGATDGGHATIGELASEALDGARRVQDIVQDLRRFARGEERTTTAVDVHAALDGAIRLAANQIRYRARLVRDFAPDLPLVVGNTSSLTQVFLNLIVNAAQAMPEGSSEANEIRVRTSATDDDVRIELSDTGAGIAPENMARIFDPFFSTKDVTEGTGLGLAMCHQLVDAIGGRIFVGSEVGRGSRFLVTLKRAVVDGAHATPVTPGPDKTPPVRTSVDARPARPRGATWIRAEAPARPPRSKPAPLSPVSPLPTAPVGPSTERERRPRVLVVDDEDLLRRSLVRTLSRQFDVTAAASAEDAQHLLAADDPVDVILCDLMMPGMSGMAFARWLQGARPGLATRMIFMSGGAFTPESREFLAANQRPALEKPFQPSDVIALLWKVLDEP